MDLVPLQSPVILREGGVLEGLDYCPISRLRLFAA